MLAASFQALEPAADTISNSVSRAVNRHIDVRIRVLHYDGRRGHQHNPDSTSFINSTSRTVQVADAHPNLSDPSGEAFECEAEPPFNVASQLFGDGHVTVNIELHFKPQSE